MVLIFLKWWYSAVVVFGRPRLRTTLASMNHRLPELDHYHWPPGITTAHDHLSTGLVCLVTFPSPLCQLWFSGSYALWFLECLGGVFGTVKSIRAPIFKLSNGPLAHERHAAGNGGYPRKSSTRRLGFKAERDSLRS